MSNTFHNPLKGGGADPWLTYHNGSYYLCATSGNDLRMRKASRLADLADAPDQTIWQDEDPKRCRQMWAPEFFLLDGPNGLRWYCYYTASSPDGSDHRMFVLEGDTDDLLGPYHFQAQLATDPIDQFHAIDGTVLQHPSGRLYLTWAGGPEHVLYMAQMSNPWTTTGDRVLIPADGFGCADVREGPVFLQKDGRIFLVYSACDARHPDYRLGILAANAGDNPMDPACWRQLPGPVFGRSDADEVYGPGHNSFFRSPDGTEDWIVYHAKTTTEITFADRVPCAQRFTWKSDGTPYFGSPQRFGAEMAEPSGTHEALER